MPYPNGWLCHVVCRCILKHHAISINDCLFSSVEMIWNHVGNGKVFRVLSDHFSDEIFQLFSTLGLAGNT